MDGGGGSCFASLKNMVFTTLLVVMLFKVKQTGTLTLFVIVSTLVNFLLLGGNITLIVPMLVAALLSELLMALVRKAGLPGSVYWGVGCFDLICKFGSLGISYLMMQRVARADAVVIPL